MKVAIDGTVASGKDSVSHRVAKRCQLVFIETGALYRSVAWYALKQGYLEPFLELENEIADLNISLKKIDDIFHVFVEGEDSTPFLRSSKIDFVSSVIASTKALRIPMLQKQRQMSLEYDRVLMSGRAIGTSVLPDADIKIYLDADLEVRAKRRFEDRKKTFPEVTIDLVKEEIKKRDEINQQRDFDPDVIPDGAIFIDTTHLQIVEVVDQIVSLIESKDQEKI